jgi:hypothetical protein
MAAPARHRALIALAASALALAGCGQSVGGIAGGGKVIGRTVTVYSVTTSPAQANRDFVDGEKLALADAHGRAGTLAVNFTSLDLGSGTAEEAATASRRAINDPQIIAAVADATDVTVPLFNAAGILQVAPGGDLALARDPHALPLGQRTVAPLDATAAGRQAAPAGFAARFRTSFGRAPRPGAERGYRAMRSILTAVAKAGTAGNDRQHVIDAYFSPRHAG